MSTACRCQSGLRYDDCCQPVHLRLAAAPTAERLMRSRYCAFALQDGAYLLQTWHSATRPASIEFDPDLHWYQLQILSRSGGGLLDQSGTVEFVARYRVAGKIGEQYENSYFVRAPGGWLYLGPADDRSSLRRSLPLRPERPRNLRDSS